MSKNLNDGESVKYSFARTIALCFGTVFSLFLAACGDSDGGTNSETDSDSQGGGNTSVVDQDSYASEDDLPGCMEKFEGKVAFVEDGSVAFKCEDGRWENKGTFYATNDDIKNCTSKREGKTAYIVDEDKSFVCQDGKWVKVEMASSSRNDENVGESSSSSSRPSGLDPESSTSSRHCEESQCDDAAIQDSTASSSAMSNATGSSSSSSRHSGLDPESSSSNDEIASSSSNSRNDEKGISSSAKSSSSLAKSSSSTKSGSSSSSVKSSSSTASSSSIKSSSSSALSSSSVKSSSSVASSSSAKSSSSVKLSSSSLPSNYSMMTDSRDGRTYKTVKIGSQEWMAENLNYNMSGSKCYNITPSNCTKYGRLYTQEAAYKACPSGWHLPNTAEWNILISNVKPASDLLLENNNTGFAALLAGSSRNAPGSYAIFWTADANKSANIGTSYNGVYNSVSGEEIYVRCLKGVNTVVSSSSVRSSSSSAKSSSSIVSSSSVQSSSSINVNAGSRYDAASNTLTDLRDGKIYKTTKIGTMIFTAENMNIELENSYCYENDSLNCVKYGRLYVWDAASKACPSGWHLPESAEWSALLDEVGGKKIAGIKLKSADGWSNGGNGTDDFSFNALSAGGRYPDGRSFSQGILASFWGSTKKSNSYVNLYFMDNTDVGYIEYSPKEYGMSVRCIKDGSYVPPPPKDSSVYNASENTLKDLRNYKTYKTVKIGSQIWMAQNLNYSDSVQTPSLKGKSWCHNNSADTCAKYGPFYSWAAAIDSVALYDGGRGIDCGHGKECVLPDKVRGICPSGWHLPDSVEWSALLVEVGGKKTAGVALKSKTGWKVRSDGSSGNGSDLYGFSVQPMGSWCTNYNGFHSGFGRDALFWSATQSGPGGSFGLVVQSDGDIVYLSWYSSDAGYSIRCLKD